MEPLVGKGGFEPPTSRSRTVHSNLTELLPEGAQYTDECWVPLWSVNWLTVPIYLVRHGATAWTDARRHTGKSDIPLTEVGEEQARDVGHRLAGIEFARVVCSPRLRALRTAELAGLGARVQVDPRLSEYDYGEYEGLTSEQIQALNPGWELWADGCPNGETPGAVLARARELLGSLGQVDHRNVVLFGHGHILRALAAAYLEVPVGFCRHLILRVASISLLGQEHGQPAIDLWDLT